MPADCSGGRTRSRRRFPAQSALTASLSGALAAGQHCTQFKDKVLYLFSSFHGTSERCADAIPAGQRVKQPALAIVRCQWSLDLNRGARIQASQFDCESGGQTYLDFSLPAGQLLWSFRVFPTPSQSSEEILCPRSCTECHRSPKSKSPTLEHPAWSLPPFPQNSIYNLLVSH